MERFLLQSGRELVVFGGDNEGLRTLRNEDLRCIKDTRIRADEGPRPAIKVEEWVVV